MKRNKLSVFLLQRVPCHFQKKFCLALSYSRHPLSARVPFDCHASLRVSIPPLHSFSTDYSPKIIVTTAVPPVLRSVTRAAVLRSPVPRSVRTHFQVREIRVQSFGVVLAVLETVARPVNLAQASQSRPGEMKQGARLVLLHEKSPRRLAQVLSEQATRPSERDLA
ncbi:hypothetical protein DEO72_LG10g3424 [Vigna unguiculata]|uniref:Uncharacterized protein n=1 Tax=Vigna unguiculata TaxID=3917 RepID=A0A4D6NE86_VIGUN|nr:hypothetical protein DEO72_LG10g3424 [Vigna unguiculata]